jgi:hypothetical protein
MATFSRSPKDASPPLIGTKAPIEMVPDNPVGGGAVVELAVGELRGAIKDVAAPYITTSPITRPIMKTAIVILVDFFCPDMLFPSSSLLLLWDLWLVKGEHLLHHTTRLETLTVLPVL